jgi:hypothetical protein
VLQKYIREGVGTVDLLQAWLLGMETKMTTVLVQASDRKRKSATDIPDVESVTKAFGCALSDGPISIDISILPSLISLKGILISQYHMLKVGLYELDDRLNTSCPGSSLLRATRWYGYTTVQAVLEVCLIGAVPQIRQTCQKQDLAYHEYSPARWKFS